MTPMRAPVLRHFSALKDPRRANHNKNRHKLVDVIVIAICAALCGIDDFEHMEIWAKQRADWLGTFLELPNGIPSHNTINRIFAKINPAHFHECFIAWVADVATLCKGEVVAIDGKTLRGAFDRAAGKAAIHMVSAWATTQRLILGQRAVDDKSNEITAIPKLLEALDLAGCLVTIDAMGTQRDIAEQIVAAGADYTLALKANQKTLHEDVVATFEKVDLTQMEAPHFYATEDKGHGRIDVRLYYLITDVATIQEVHNWPGLKSIGLVRSLRVVKGSESIEDRYFLSSYKGNARKFANAVRGHWGIESSHWQLDVSAFNEDKCRVRKKNAPENLAVLRRAALNLHKRNPDKGSLKTKTMKCMMNLDYMLKTLIS